MASFYEARGQRPIESPVPFEDRISFTDRSANACFSRCFQQCPSMTLKGDATRVVGRGLTPEQDLRPDGTLQNPEKYIQDGVIDAVATLHLSPDPPIGQPDGWGGEQPCAPWTVSSEIEINGFSIDAPLVVEYCTSTGRANPQHLSVSIPAKYLRFAVRNENGLPTPKENTLEIQSSASIYDLPGECGDHASYQLNEAYVEFKAMAPVLAVHGCCGETESWFTGTETDRETGAQSDNSNYPPPRIAEEFANRRAGFRTARFSFDPKTRQAKIEGGAPHFAEEVIQTLREFGSQTINLLAHSKGGLRARHLLSSAEWRNTGARSLVTIATPHYGSVVAEWVKAQRESARRGEYIGRLLSWATEFTEQEIDELTQDGANAIVNRPYAAPPESFVISGKKISPRYWTIGADADRNGDRILELGELANLTPDGSSWIPGKPGATAAVATLAYRIAGLDKYVYTEKTLEPRAICPTLQPPCWTVNVPVHRIREVPHNESFRPNDIVVTRRSAAYQFQEARFYSGGDGQNHHSIGNYGFTGRDVYALFRMVPK